jgi:hypothetical protein
VIGIEGEAEYIEIAKSRIKNGGVFSGLLDKKMRPKRESKHRADSSTGGSHVIDRRARGRVDR